MECWFFSAIAQASRRPGTRVALTWVSGRKFNRQQERDTHQMRKVKRQGYLLARQEVTEKEYVRLGEQLDQLASILSSALETDSAMRFD